MMVKMISFIDKTQPNLMATGLILSCSMNFPCIPSQTSSLQTGQGNEVSPRITGAFCNFEDIEKAFPKAKYNGTMDFVCKLANGDFSLVEMQVLPKDNWDERALAYAAAFYGKQIGKGQNWFDHQESLWHRHSRRRHSTTSSLGGNS